MLGPFRFVFLLPLTLVLLKLLYEQGRFVEDCKESKSQNEEV